jgi:hypothetical protein
MDVVYDYVSVTTFWTILLIVHGLLAVALLGALTHQAASVLVPARQTAGMPSFTGRFRSVHGASYASAVCVLWVATFIFGAWIYAKYRMYVRIPIEQEAYWKTLGSFELKEHLAAISVGLLPIYWVLWKNPHEPEFEGPRKWLTVSLAAMCWYMFLVGHVLNNVRGFGS